MTPEECPVSVIEFFQQRHIEWSDRISLQSALSLKDKGWNVAVQWKETAHGVGVFAGDSIAAGAVLRVGKNGRNLLQFKCRDDIETFCTSGSIDCSTSSSGNSDTDYQQRLSYVADYLWGYSTIADERGYNVRSRTTSPSPSPSEDDWFFGMWLPGNGLNHHVSPNTVYRTLPGGTFNGIVLVALTDIKKDQELFDDYRRHGPAPKWLLDFAAAKNVTLNFAGCNDYVS